MTALRATGLVKDYRRGRAVDGVDLTVDAGERVGLLGPNGAGKTTARYWRNSTPSMAARSKRLPRSAKRSPGP